MLETIEYSYIDGDTPVTCSCSRRLRHETYSSDSPIPVIREFCPHLRITGRFRRVVRRRSTGPGGIRTR